MEGSVPRVPRRGVRRGLAPLVALLVLCGTIMAPAGSAHPPPPPTSQPPPGRIAYSGTEHRSLGATAVGLPGQTKTEQLLDEMPRHFDQDVSSRDGLMVFTSLRDERAPQVYLRDRKGEIRKLTTGHDARNPVLSPDSRWVAFDSPGPSGDTGRDVWLVRTDGTEAHRVVAGAAEERYPTFSPDGTRLAYACDAGGRWRIYEVPVSGGEVRRLTDEPSGGAVEPAWNPVDHPGHRDKLAYTFDEDGNPDTNSDQSVRVLSGTGTGEPLLSGAQADWTSRQPRWMPDGTRVLFLSPNDVHGGSGKFDRVYRAHASSQPGEHPPEAMLTEDRLVDSPTWYTGHGSGRLVVARTTAPSRNTATLQDIRQDGTDPRDLGLNVLTEDPRAATDSKYLFEPGEGFDPWTQRQSYSPDGSMIAVSRFETLKGRRSQRIWLVGSDGSHPRPLPIEDRKPGDWETDAAWSPDGTEVAVARRSPGRFGPERGRSRIIVVDAVTGRITRSVPNDDPEQDDTQPSWSPDHKTLAFSRGRVADVPEGRTPYNHVWLARADSLDQQQDLSDLICDCEVVDDSPAFTPDGHGIAFNREPDGLYLVDLDDLSCDVLLPSGQDSCVDRPERGPEDPRQPRDVSWSPDGSRFVLSRRGDDNAPERSAVMGLTDRAVSPLADHLPGRQKEPSWQTTVNLSLTAPASSDDVAVGHSTTVTAVVRNQGPATSPGADVIVHVPPGLRLRALRASAGECDDHHHARCELPAQQAGEAIEITAEVTGLKPGNRHLGWMVRGRLRDSQEGDDTATTTVPVSAVPIPPPPPPYPPPPPPPLPPPPTLFPGPGVAVSARPVPSYVGGRTDVVFTVRNTGSGTATGLALTMALPPGVPVVRTPSGCTVAACPLPDLPPGGSLTRRVVLAPNEELEATIGVSLRTTGPDSNSADNVAAVPYRVLRPRIVAVPEVGEPGFVTSVRGVDFPPGVPVRLSWSRGITAAAAPTYPRGDGRFAAQLLILPKDQTGPRVITAAGPGFAPARTDFLVVAPTITPPDLVARR